MLWIGIGTQVAKAYGMLKLDRKMFTVTGCVNATAVITDLISPNLNSSRLITEINESILAPMFANDYSCTYSISYYQQIA